MRQDQAGRRPHHSGRLVVILLLLAGLVAGGISVSYWSGQGSSDAGPADPRVLDEELIDLEQRVQNAIDNKRVHTVRADVESYVARHGDDARGFKLLAKVFLAEKMLEAALAQFKASLALDPAQGDAELFCGTICMKLGQAKKAEKHYLEAMGLDPSDMKVRLHLGDCLIEQGRLTDARDILVKILAADSSLHETHGMLAEVYLKQNRLNLASSQISKAIDKAPLAARADEVKYHRMRAMILRRMNRPGEALQTLEENLIESERRAFEVVREMALCYSAQGRFREAAIVYESALKDDPADPRLHEAAARTWVKAGEPSKARIHVERIRALEREWPVLAELEKLLDR